jgi:D-alanyl-D-alanine carboxypeptidase
VAERLQAVWAGLGIPADYARKRGMPVQRTARTLVSIGRAADDNKPVKLTPRAAAAWRKMRAAAALDGADLRPISGYRSVARQIRIVRRKLAAGERIADVLRFVAAPGCSEHHTGRALDIGSPVHLELDEHFARTAEFRWLKQHASRFGFYLSYPRSNRHGIGYEPWHWCWRSGRR